MKRAVVTAFVLTIGFVLPSAAAAQSIGVLGGASFANMRGSVPDGTVSGTLGLEAGVYFTRPANDFLDLHVEALFSRKGAAFHFPTFESSPVVVARVTYFELPVLLEWKLGSRIKVSGGMVLAWKVGHHETIEIAGRDDQLYPYYSNYVKDSVDGSLAIGGQFQLKKHAIGVRYTHGFANLAARPDTTLRNHTLAFTFIMPLWNR